MTVADLIAKLRTVDQGLTVLSDGYYGYDYETGDNIVVALVQNPSMGFDDVSVHIRHDGGADSNGGFTKYEVL